MRNTLLEKVLQAVDPGGAVAGVSTFSVAMRPFVNSLKNHYFT